MDERKCVKGKDKKALHSQTTAQLLTLLREKQGELVKVRMDIATRKAKNVHAKKTLRREIAVLMSIKRIKELQHD